MFLSPPDVVEQAFREKQHTASPHCTSLTYYVFRWSSLVKALSKDTIHVKKVYLRSYLKIDQQHNANNQITLTSTMSIDNGKKSAHMHEGGSLTAQQSQKVIPAQIPGQWIEIDLTKAVKQLLPHIKQSTDVQITVRATVDCANQIEAPPRFVQPAEIPLEFTEMRESTNTFQPLLVVFANNDAVTKMKNTTITKSPDTSKPDRGRRSSSNACKRHDHVLVFSDIGLNGTIPVSLNIGKCSGSCSYSHLNQQTSLGTNHAKIMSSVQQTQLRLPHKRVTLNGPATTPCCVPASYRPRTTLFIIDEDRFSLHNYYAYYNDLEVVSCSCQ